ncbi:MAG: hypothetical protein V2J10_04610 [Wenzhouxiangella sp.]|nr:hypothetical protein [Wenzhouxiangella sp.]
MRTNIPSPLAYRLCVGLLILTPLSAPIDSRAQLDPLDCNNINLDLMDCLGLVSIYNFTDGDNWLENGGWGNPNPAFWFGITIKPGTNRVQRIELPRNWLSGSLPPTFNGLDALEVLELTDNAIDGEIPDYFATLANLRELRLSDNEFTGSFADSFTYPGWIGGMTQLTVLELIDNEFAGGFPANLNALVNLRVLSVDSFDPVDFPLLDQLTALEHLDLSGSLILDQIPGWIGDLSMLRTLDLNFSRLTGPLPDTLGQLTQLRILDLSFNAFDGGLPASLGQLSNLEILRIRGRSPLLDPRYLSGRLPASFGKLINLKELDLFWNQLSGPLPASLGNLESLESLNLAGNDLSGPLPESFVELELQEFFIGDNFLDSDDQQKLILSPTQQAWFDQIPDAVYLWPEVGPGLFVFDSEIQRPSPFIFRDRFEP